MSRSNGKPIGCADFCNSLQLNRRSFVKAGILGTLGLSLPELLRAEAKAEPAKRLNSVIILWMRGGPSHIDMWDPKPDAPAEYRGEFGVIPTKVPGVQLGELLPMSARIMDKWSIVRSLHHEDPGHSSGDQICFTARAPPAGPNPAKTTWRAGGAIVPKHLGPLTPTRPAYVMVPRRVPGPGPAYLGVAHKPFETNADPANPGPFRIPNFALPNGV